MTVTVGVLALQGGFLEHLALLHRSAQHLATSSSSTVAANRAFAFVEVRSPQDLEQCDALIIPGGESTTIAHLAAQSDLMEPLRAFVKTARKPSWGTCAGLILLAEAANATKEGGQELIGGLDVRVRRNHFGRQVESFVADIDLPFLAAGVGPFTGVFIRAPIVEQVLASRDGPDPIEPATVTATVTATPPATPPAHDPSRAPKAPVEVLATLPGRRTKAAKGSLARQPCTDQEQDQAQGDDVSDIVAVRQGNVLATSFHPELADDIRMHVWWLEQVWERWERLSA